MAKAKIYFIETKNGNLATVESFRSLNKAREIARYLLPSSRTYLRITSTGGDVGSGSRTEGYVGMKDYKTYYWQDKLNYAYILKRDGTTGEPFSMKKR